MRQFCFWNLLKTMFQCVQKVSPLMKRTFYEQNFMSSSVKEVRYTICTHQIVSMITCKAYPDSQNYYTNSLQKNQFGLSVKLHIRAIQLRECYLLFVQNVYIQYEIFMLCTGEACNNYYPTFIVSNGNKRKYSKTTPLIFDVIQVQH